MFTQAAQYSKTKNAYIKQPVIKNWRRATRAMKQKRCKMNFKAN